MKSSIGYKVSKKKEDASEEKELKDDFKKEDESVNIRKITNGFVVRRSWREGKKGDMSYKDEETFYDKNPLD